MPLLPTMWETWVRSLGLEDALEKETVTHSSTLAWKIPWMEKHGRPWGRKESDTTEQLHFLSLQVLDAPLAAKSLQSCLTLCNPTDGSPPGSSVPGILQARTLEWVAIFFSSYMLYGNVNLNC